MLSFAYKVKVCFFFVSSTAMLHGLNIPLNSRNITAVIVWAVCRHSHPKLVLDYLFSSECESRFLGLNAAKNTNYVYEKLFQIKAVENLISYKKLSTRTCLSLPGVELGGSHDCHV